MAARKRTDARTLGNWDRLKTALAVHRGGTLSAAGRLLGTDHTTIARQLRAFERELGGELFERGPDGLFPTPLGEEVTSAAQRVEDEINRLLRRLDGAARGPTGTVRLTATPHLVASLLAPAVRGFLKSFPELRIELIGENRRLDLSGREADLAIRMAPPETPGLVAKRLGEIGFACYAAVRDRRPFETQVFLAYGDDFGNAPLQHYLARLVPADRIVLRSNTMQALIAAARDGLGCGLLPCFTAESDPLLRRVAVPRAMPPLPVWLVYHEDLRRSPRVRAGVEFVTQVMAENRERLVPAGFPAP